MIYEWRTAPHPFRTPSFLWGLMTRSKGTTYIRTCFRGTSDIALRLLSHGCAIKSSRKSGPSRLMNKVKCRTTKHIIRHTTFPYDDDDDVDEIFPPSFGLPVRTRVGTIAGVPCCVMGIRLPIKWH